MASLSISNSRLITSFIVLIACVLGGCVSKSAIPELPDNQSATVTIYRSGELQGSLTDVYIGWDDQYYVSLAPKQFSRINIQSGFKTFAIRAHADWHNELTLEITTGQSLCLMAEVNPQNVAGLNWVVSGYRLRQLPCTDIADKNSYEQVFSDQ